jgi:hypothetical protein
VGRDPILDQARILLGRVKERRSEKSMLLTGLRGVGKTVLLNEIGRMARAHGYLTVEIEAHEGKPLAPLMAAHLRELLYQLNRQAGVSNKTRRGLRVLRSFVGSLKVTYGDISIGLDIDPETGSADSGDIEIDLPNLFIALGEAAEERRAAIAVIIDEIQYFSSKELASLIMAMHQMQQRQLPVVLVGAGWPTLPGMAGQSKSYAERLFSFPMVGALTEGDSAKALAEPARIEGVSYDDDALHEIFALTRGYPYFIQEWGYQTWNLATASPITLALVQHATALVTTRLDEGFFRVRFDRLTLREKGFLRAMASLGTGPKRMADVANVFGVALNTSSPLRAGLIRKGMIYSPGHGDIDFTVPLFDEFLVRTMPDSPSG